MALKDANIHRVNMYSYGLKSHFGNFLWMNEMPNDTVIRLDVGYYRELVAGNSIALIRR